MLIDWFTVGAQALNFLILVWLMRRFLYTPILHAIAEREKRIAAELTDAAASKSEAKKERDEFRHKNEDFDRERAALLGKVADEANAAGQRLVEEARKAADAVGAKRRETLRQDARTLNHAITCRAQEAVFAIARKALTDLASTSLEERIGEIFTRRLREMDGADKERFRLALTTTSDPAILRSTFALSSEQRATIQNALNETFSAEVRLQFQTAPEVVSGIALSASGQKVGWSIADYLASLSKDVGELFDEKVSERKEPDQETKGPAGNGKPKLPLAKLDVKSA